MPMSRWVEGIQSRWPQGVAPQTASPMGHLPLRASAWGRLRTGKIREAAGNREDTLLGYFLPGRPAFRQMEFSSMPLGIDTVCSHLTNKETEASRYSSTC